MTKSEYEQKKRECWEEYKRTNLDGEVQWQPVSRYDVFCAAFDRAYAIGKQKETITQEDVEKATKEYADSLGKCREVTWNDAVYGFISGVAYALGKQTETVTQEEIEKAAEEFADGVKIPPSAHGVMVPFINGLAHDSYLQGAQDFIGKQEKEADTVIVDKEEYDKLCKRSRYIANWVPYYSVCPICGEYNPSGCICANCNNDKNWNK